MRVLRRSIVAHESWTPSRGQNLLAMYAPKAVIDARLIAGHWESHAYQIVRRRPEILM
jgi:hypothetical protein